LSRTEEFFMSDETYRPTHGAVPPDPDATRVQPSVGHVPATGEVLGGFVLRESLGHGGFAHVYRAESPADGVVALKVLTNSQAGSRERFVTEARLLEQLGGRGFPAFVRGDLDAPTPWFAMELVPGRTLSQVVHEHGPLPRQDLLRVADDVAGALAVLQEEHYLHRDVKPANIIVSDGRCVLIDLGIAKGHGSQTSTHAAGTIAYMAPELFVRKPHPRSDVYSLGLLLIFCATGTLPADLNFAGRDLTPEDVGPVDPAILPLVLAMTRQDPAERPPLHNIARAVVSLASQQAPEPGLLHAAETTHVERGVVTEVVTAGGDPPAPRLGGDVRDRARLWKHHRLSDGAGTTCKLVIVEQTCDDQAQNRIVMYGEGAYEGTPFQRPINAQCVVMLRSGTFRDDTDATSLSRGSIRSFASIGLASNFLPKRFTRWWEKRRTETSPTR
jgi:serine/threonine protein kinase